MTPAYWLVLLNAAVFGLYGLAFLVWPSAMAVWVTGVAPLSSSAMIDLRATYGGMSLAVGGVLYLLARSPQHHRLGLQAVLSLMLCMAGGRIIGMWVEGDANAMMGLYLGLELLMAVVAALALKSR